jgi:hypothetical protein
MKRQEAHKIIEQRWIDLWLERKAAPVMFNVDVDRLLEDNPEEGAESDDERARR